MTAIPCKYGCGTVMSAEHAEGGTHYERHRRLCDTVKVQPGAHLPAKPIFGLWHGGPNYGPSYLADHLEVFHDVEDAEDAMSGRARNGHWQPQDYIYANGERGMTLYPNVRGSWLELYFTDPRDMLGDATPDLILEQGEEDEITRRSA